MKLFFEKKCLILILVIIFIFIFSPNLFASPDAVICNVQVTNTRDDLIVYFDVENAFTDEINQAVLKGIPATFSFYIVLDQTKRVFFDKEISDYKITSTLKYNTLKKEFIVSRPWENEKPFITDSFEEAKQIMTQIDNLSVSRLSNLTKGKKYVLELKADLDKVTLPLKLHYILFFVSFWDFETDWNVTKFTY